MVADAHDADAAIAGAVSLHRLSREAHRVVRDLPGSGRVVPVSRNGEVVGVMVETSLSDVAGRGLASRADRFVSVRDFVRGNMSSHVGMVADGGEALVVWKRNRPTVLLIPLADAIAEGLLPRADDLADRSPPGRALSEAELTSGVETVAPKEQAAGA